MLETVSRSYFSQKCFSQWQSSRRWATLMWLSSVVALALTGCSGLALPGEAPVVRTVAPTFTPTALGGVPTPARVMTPIGTPIAPAQANNNSGDAVGAIAASADAATNEQTAPNSVAEIDANGLDLAERRVVDVYQRVSPAVVSISTRVLRRNFYFEAVPEEGAGTGFVIDRAGNILTNYHVIEEAERIEVYFGNDVAYEADVVGIDPRNDIAVIRVDAPEELLIPVEFGSSDNLVVGQRAIAIGNPFGQFGRTMTTGVISAVGRTLEGQDGRTITGVIQTDAAINRGNSGGPLLDSSGRVIGINSAIFSPTGANAGVGFAIPIETVQRLLPDLLTLGRYPHPWLGIRYAYAVSPGLAEILKLPVEQGLLLVQTYEGSPLAEGGARGAQTEAILGNQRVYIGGDVLLAIDGIMISRLGQLETLLEDEYRVGDTVEVTLLRDNEQYTLQVQLAEEPY